MKSAVDTMPDTQLEILQMLADGKHLKEIADHLKISISAVKGRVARLYARLGVHRPGPALAAYLRLNQPRLKLFQS